LNRLRAEAFPSHELSCSDRKLSCRLSVLSEPPQPESWCLRPFQNPSREDSGVSITVFACGNLYETIEPCTRLDWPTRRRYLRSTVSLVNSREAPPRFLAKRCCTQLCDCRDTTGLPWDTFYRMFHFRFAPRVLGWIPFCQKELL